MRGAADGGRGNIKFPEPLISMAVEPKLQDDIDKLNNGLRKLSEEDPTFTIRTDDETGQTIISGMGELHLEVITSRMQREVNTRVNVGKHQVVYRETIEKRAEGSAVFDREVAGQHHFGEVRLRLAVGKVQPVPARLPEEIVDRQLLKKRPYAATVKQTICKRKKMNEVKKMMIKKLKFLILRRCGVLELQKT